jgi:hypothetical protein
MDRMLYIVVCAHRLGDYLPERNLCDLDLKTTLKDICEGQFKDIKHVYEVNVVEGTSRDVTEDVLRAAGPWE